MYPQQGGPQNYGAAQIVNVGGDAAQIQMYYDKLDIGYQLANRQERIKKQERDQEAQNKFILSKAVPVHPTGQREFNDAYDKVAADLASLENPTQADYYTAATKMAQIANGINVHAADWEKARAVGENLGVNMEGIQRDYNIASEGVTIDERAQSGVSPMAIVENMPGSSAYFNMPKLVNNQVASLPVGSYGAQSSDGTQRTIETKVIYEADPTSAGGFRVKRGEDGLMNDAAYNAIKNDPLFYRAADDQVWGEAIDRALSKSLGKPVEEITNEERRAAMVSVQSGEEGDKINALVRNEYNSIPEDERKNIEKSYLTELLDPYAAGKRTKDNYVASNQGNQSNRPSSTAGGTWLGNDGKPSLYASGMDVIPNVKNPNMNVDLEVAGIARKNNVMGVNSDGEGVIITHIARGSDGKYYVKGDKPMKDGKGVARTTWNTSVNSGDVTKYTYEETGWLPINSSFEQAVVGDAAVGMHKQNAKASFDDIFKQLFSGYTSEAPNKPTENPGFTP